MNKKIRLTEAQLRDIISRSFYKITGYVGLEDGIYDIEDRNEIIKYANIVWEIMNKSYASIGGFRSYQSKDDLANLVSLLTICVSNHKIVAVATYRDDLGGQKLNACGTIDGSKEHKDLLKQVIKSDIENLEKYHWVEVSQPIEEWFKELGGNPIPSAMASNLLHKSKNKIELLDDNVHYKRAIGNNPQEIVTKAIYGFKDLHTYDKVMQKLEEYTGFEHYDDFKKSVNHLPKINEDIDYLSNHPDAKISIAMEVIIQFANLYEDGIYEVSPNMYNYLKSSVEYLKCIDCKDKQVVSCLRTGNHFLKIFSIIEMHTYDEASYILSPLM